jgi:hypothetical protein
VLQLTVAEACTLLLMARFGVPKLPFVGTATVQLLSMLPEVWMSMLSALAAAGTSVSAAIAATLAQPATLGSPPRGIPTRPIPLP